MSSGMWVPYKGYTIDPWTFEAADQAGWMVQAMITFLDDDAESSPQKLVIDHVFASRSRAISAAIEFARRRIDMVVAPQAIPARRVRPVAAMDQMAVA